MMTNKSDPVFAVLQAARVRLLIDWPIFGSLLLNMEPKEVEWCPTAATDGKYFYYNREFLKKLDRAQILWLTAHELLHAIFNHIYRRGRRNPDLWNMAVDYKVNYVLETTLDEHNEKIGRKIEPPVATILFDNAYNDDLSSDEIYALLEKNSVRIEMPIDMHLDLEAPSKDKDGESGEGDGEGNESGDGPPRYTAEELEDIRDNIRMTLLQSAQQNTDPGKIPLGIQRMLKTLLEPKIDWRQMLDHVLRSAIRYDYTYLRRSRRFWSTGYLLPGRNVEDKITAVAFLDGSGSTTQEMVTDFLTECKGIMDSFRDFELTIGTFDTEVYDVKKFTPDNSDEIETYRKEFRGGGGTAPTCCWNYMKKHEIMPHRLLLFTDGYVGSDWGDPDYCDTLFIVHSNKNAKAPYGLTAHYEPRTMLESGSDAI